MRFCGVLQLRQWLSIVLILTTVCVASVCHADQSYRDGLAAYLDGEYQSAQSHWLKSAKAGNPKSMFNLGLLHEQSKIANAQDAKAQEWYRLAGNSGYSAADYHLALKLFQKDKNSKKAAALMKRAASNDFALAVNYVGGKRKPVSQPKPVTSVQPKTKTKPKPSISKYQTESWVLDKRAKYWTIQMLAFNEEQKVRSFIDQNKLNAKAGYFKERSSNEVFYKLIYGVYKTKVQADFARQNLPSALKEHGPWLRSIESVQAVIKAQ